MEPPQAADKREFACAMTDMAPEIQSRENIRDRNATMQGLASLSQAHEFMSSYKITYKAAAKTNQAIYQGIIISRPLHNICTNEPSKTYRRHEPRFITGQVLSLGVSQQQVITQ